MKHKSLPVLLIVAAIVFAAGAVCCIVMTVMAVRFSEWGRVAAYGLAGIACLEALILAAAKIKNKDNS